MDLHVWNPSTTKNVIKDKSYCAISEDLINWSYYTNLPPNEEMFCSAIVNGGYDNLFDFSKDVIDVGACHGVYSIELCKKFNHAYAFEANKTYSYLIATNAVLNNVVDKVDIYNVFLSDTNDNANFNGWVSDKNDFRNGGYIDTTLLTSSCYETQYNVNNIYNYNSIPCKTLDSYNFNNIGFIKTDTEGNDLRVLKGAINTIKNNNYPPILFEMWPEDSPFITDKEQYKNYCNELISFLQDLGYDITYGVNQYPDTHLAINKHI